MEIELIIFLTMLGVFLIGNFLFKLPVSLSMIAGAIGGALVAGEGLPLRHLFEGTFVYMDTLLIIASAMVFMSVIQESGALEALNAGIRQKIRQALGLDARVELVNPRSLKRFEGKAKRVTDKRNI